MSRVWRVIGSAAVVLSLAMVPLVNRQAAATPVQPGFQEETAFGGLVQPTNLEFSPDGRVFVAEKSGIVKVFDGVADNTATVFADLRLVVHNVWDRGLLGMALDPDFPAHPWVYVLYTYDAPPGQTAPYWNDDCNSVTGGANGGRCVVTARLSRLQASGDHMTGNEQVLIRDWCQQYPSHSVGELQFGADGALYVSAGDGASFTTVDYGQLPSGGPINPCGDPPGGNMQPPTAEGGALRSQSLTSTLSNPLSLDGKILRLDPATGGPMPDNPLINQADINRQRSVASGLRNPFRFTTRPGTGELWIGDVGWNSWEEINVLSDPTGSPADFGWPCYEGSGKMSSYASVGLNLCSTRYDGPGQTGPFFTYSHSAHVVPGEACPTGTSSITGLAFYPQTGGSYPNTYNGALFFADYSRQCIWVMRPSQAGGLPDPANLATFTAPAGGPVDLEVGPDGELYWADLGGGTIRRMHYTPDNTPPTGVIETSSASGPVPLTVDFDGSGSSDPDPGDQSGLTYEWDFTDDGQVDATGPTASFIYQTAGAYTARLTVTDMHGASDSTTVTVQVGVEATIDAPRSATTWAVGDQIDFSGHGSDYDGAILPSSALHWQLRLKHCSEPDNCHSHVVQDWDGAAGGTFVAPDHEYPSWLELALTATGSNGLTHTVVRELHPKTVDLTMASDPPGLVLSIGAVTAAAPFTETVIRGSQNTISAPSPQTLNERTFTFSGWQHGGGQTQVITAPATGATYTAAFDAAGFIHVGDFQNAIEKVRPGAVDRSPHNASHPGTGGSAGPERCLTKGGDTQLTTLRYAGANRYETAVCVSYWTWYDHDDPQAPANSKATAVVLARGDLFPDALAGGPLAAYRQGPLLLTTPTSLRPEVKSEIERVLAPGGLVYLLGGTASLANGIRDELQQAGYQTKRLAGSNRYETAIAVAEEMPDTSNFFFATGADFPDGLAAGNAASALSIWSHLDTDPATRPFALLLTNGDLMPTSTLSFATSRGNQFGTWTLVTAGGPADQAARNAFGTVNLSARLAGSNRYDTAAQIAEAVFASRDTGRLVGNGVGLATGLTFPDALSATASLAVFAEPSLLTSSNQLSSATGAFLASHAGDGAYLDVFGGTSAVSDAAVSAAEAAFR
jgi:glucose/arabinose dehydrogenase/PKD repeat protein